MKKIFIVFIAVIFTTHVAAQQLVDKIPIRVIRDLVVLEIKVNDNERPLNFIFDTGAGVTIIDLNIAKQIPLNITGKTKIGTTGNSVFSEESILNTLSLSSMVSLDSVSMYLMDLAHISKYLDCKIDGIIGYDLLKSTIVEINIDNSEMRFYSVNTFSNAKNLESYPLIFLESNHFGVPISITPMKSNKAIKLTFKIDSGAANYLTFHNRTVVDFNLLDAKKKYKIKKGFGADSTITKNLDGKISSLSFGNSEWKRIPVVFEVDPVNNNPNRQADGLIGQKVLMDFNITYNLAAGFLLLEKRK